LLSHVSNEISLIALVQMKLIIIGNSGSGKTWLATRLAAATKTSVVRLDEIFWEPGGFNQKRSSEELDRLITETKQGTSWIVEGVFGELTERYFDEAELFIWLDIDWEICKARLLTRGSESKRHLGRMQSEKGLGELIEWASKYYDRDDSRSFAGHKNLFDRFAGEKVRIKSQHDASEFLINPQFQIASA
jgi:adenylate kinase family enzyme